MTARRQDPRRLDQDHADARTLRAAAAALRAETNQARYTNRDLDPYPLFTLAELLDILAREVSTGELHPRHAVRRGALDLARQLQRKVGPSGV
ncbi:MAG: hypothetical protein LC749_08330 [Actinobacteria bacterium]|nr:hypothetical protein [Actinomycetota bacterium]